MLYGLKTAIMKKALTKRKSNNPFDYKAAEEYVLPENADPVLNNSYYFSAHGADGESLYCRLGIRSCHSEVWFCYVSGAKKYVHTRLIYETDSPLKISKRGIEWNVSFDGELEDEEGKSVPVSFNGTFVSDAQPVDFFSDMPSERTAKAIAYEKWSKKFFAEVQENNQVHYEQTGTLFGKIMLFGKEREINMPCVRDHSFGKRDWGYMNNHLWLMAVSRTGQLNFSMVSYPAMTMLEVGNFITEGKPMAYILGADYGRASVAKGSVPATLELTLRLDGEREIKVSAKKSYETEYLFSDGAYALYEAIADFEIDGESYRGIMELGFNREPSRWFNGRKIKDLRD